MVGAAAASGSIPVTLKVRGSSPGSALQHQPPGTTTFSWAGGRLTRGTQSLPPLPGRDTPRRGGGSGQPRPVERGMPERMRMRRHSPRGSGPAPLCPERHNPRRRGADFFLNKNKAEDADPHLPPSSPRERLGLPASRRPRPPPPPAPLT